MVRLDIEIYEDYGEHTWAQARYLVHGYDDVLWTNSLEDVAIFLRSEMRKLEQESKAVTLLEEIATEVEEEMKAGGLTSGIYFEFTKEVAKRYALRRDNAQPRD